MREGDADSSLNRRSAQGLIPGPWDCDLSQRQALKPIELPMHPRITYLISVFVTILLSLAKDLQTYSNQLAGAIVISKRLGLETLILNSHRLHFSSCGPLHKLLSSVVVMTFHLF